MVNHKYGTFSDEQFEYAKKKIQKNIFFLLLCVDPNTKDNYNNIDINNTINSLLYKLNGMNEILFYPSELVDVMSLLEAAKLEYKNIDFNFKIYRKLILDAGSEIMKVKSCVT